MTPAVNRERGAVALHVVAVVLALVLAAVAVVFVATRHTAQTESGRTADPAPTTPTGSGAGIDLPEPTAPDDVLGPADDGAATANGVARAITPLLVPGRLGGHVAVEVARLGDRSPLWHNDVDQLVVPASTMKLFTTTAAMEVLGPDHRFTTSVVSGSRGQVILVGGGDPLLTDKVSTADSAGYPRPATLADLAAQTARGLRAAGTGKVRLGYDDSLFTGPAVNPAWQATYIPESIVSPITALWVDEGRATAGLALRVADPSAEAARRFAALLESRGITVNGAPASARAADGADELGSVSSPPLVQIVQRVLELSDNEGAEVLFRHVAVATGRPGSSAAASAAVAETLTSLGVRLGPDAVLHDGSGLARSDRVPSGALVDVLQAAASDDHPELRGVVSGLPVAGFSGSLDYRFVGIAPAGLGLVRAKTGTLTEAGVHGLAGLADGPGGVFVFAVVADEVPVRKAIAARAQLDRIAAALATCC